MSSARQRLTLHPERCGRCGACVRVCEQRALKVGGGYVYVDSGLCDECLACTRVCTSQALAASSGGAGRAVVKSRAEAKAVRKSASSAGSKATPGPSTSAAPPRVAAGPAPATAPKAAFRPSAGPHGTSATTPSGTFTLLDAAAVMAVLAAAFLLKDAIIGAAAFAALPDEVRVYARLGVLGLYYLVQLGGLAFVASRHGRGVLDAFGLRDTGRGMRERLRLTGWVVALFVGARAASLAWGASTQALGWAPPGGGAESGFAGLFGAGALGLVLTLGMVALIGPLVEELVFRGVVLRALSGRFRSGIAVVATAALFAVSHLVLWVLVPTFVLGLALAFLAEEKRSLPAAIALHALYNASAILAAFYASP